MIRSDLQRPFHIPFSDATTHRQCLLTEDDRGPKVLQRIGLTWLHRCCPTENEIDEILAATGED